jgi:iron complex outermembrane receptor protein
MSMHHKWRVGAAVAALVMAAAGAAPAGWAQSAPDTASTLQGPAALEEVVVSARKTDENIEEVPLAIRSFDPEALQKSGQVGLMDIAELTPGFLFETFSSTFDSSPTIRGLAQFDVTTPQANAPAFIDGVYIPRDYSIDLGIADVSRVEIVKGPQSALYGANAFAGLISYTLAPPPKKPEADVTVVAGNAGRIDTKFSAGDAFFDDIIAVRANYASSKYQGTWGNSYPTNYYGENLHVGAHDNQTYGGQVRFTPIQALEVNLDYFHLDRNETIKPTYNVVQSSSFLETDPEVKFNCGLLICGTLSTNPLAYASTSSKRLPGIVQPDLPGFTSGTDFYSARLRYDLTDELHLNYTYGWVGAYATEITDPTDDPVTPSLGINLSALATGAFQLGNFVSIQKEGGTNQLGSHEVRLDWDHGPIKALAGFYSSHDTDRYEFALGSVAPLSTVTGTAPTQPFNLKAFPFVLEAKTLLTDTTAEFARVSYDFLDAKANVAAEVRHSKEDLTQTYTGVQSTTFNDTTPRFTASYKLADTNLLYLSAAEGIKDGGFNPPTESGYALPVAEQTFTPEKNWTYELGTKSKLFDGRAIINADVFLVKWSALQIQTAATFPPGEVPPGTPIVVITQNYGNATSKGFESDGLFAATRNIDLTYSLALIDATFNSGDVSGRYAADGVCNNIICPENGYIGGKQLPRTSKVQASGGATWKAPISADISYAVHGEFTYQSDQQVEEMNLAQIPSRLLFNANASLKGDNWDVTLWGRNIFDKKYVADSFFILQAGEASYSASLGELATYGVTFSLHYR